MNDKDEMVGEDEEGCLEDYKTNGLVAPSATFPCQSETHNKESPAIQSTIFNRTEVQGSFVGYMYDILIIPIGTIVNIFSTRCNRVTSLDQLSQRELKLILVLFG